MAQGAGVAITGRNKTTLDAAAKELGPNLLAFRADVLDSKARELIFNEIKDEFGHLDIVWRSAFSPAPVSSPDARERGGSGNYVRRL